MTTKVTVEVYDAVGGPEMSSVGPDGFEAGPTDPGEYRVAYCGRHISRRYPDWSTIPWGAALKDEDGTLYVHHQGRWQRVFDVVGKTRDDVLDYYLALYGVRAVPTRWVFNDFGHVTCYFFKDTNNNKRFDEDRETLHAEFFHTTPIDEALTALSKTVDLQGSHGCVHLKPVDISSMIRRGFMRPGNLVVVHPYFDRKVIFPRRGAARGPYELHFFPAMKKLLVIGHPY